jgi:hypothetical protein
MVEPVSIVAQLKRLSHYCSTMKVLLLICLKITYYMGALYLYRCRTLFILTGQIFLLLSFSKLILYLSEFLPLIIISNGSTTKILLNRL